MKITVVSYSLTGNNLALATGLASALAAEHINITEPRPRTMVTIVFDLLLHRMPGVRPAADIIDSSGLVIFVGPVWMGQVATPLRVYLKHLQLKPRPYAFVSISGGADGANPRIAAELVRRTGKQPAALIDLHIADLLPQRRKQVRKDTMSYHLTTGDVENLVSKATPALQQAIAKQQQVFLIAAQ